MTIREFIKANRDKYPSNEELIKAAAKELGVQERSVRDVLSEERSIDTRTLEFQQQFDKSYIMPRKIQEVIDTWLQDRKWATDAEMQERCGIGGAADWKNYGRENPEFEKYILYANKKAIWAYSESYRDKLQAKVYSR